MFASKLLEILFWFCLQIIAQCCTHLTHFVVKFNRFIVNNFDSVLQLSIGKLCSSNSVWQTDTLHSF